MGRVMMRSDELQNIHYRVSMQSDDRVNVKETYIHQALWECYHMSPPYLITVISNDVSMAMMHT